MRQCRGLQLFREVPVGNPVEFQREKHQPRRDRRRRFLVGLIESADFGVGHIAGVDKLRVAHDTRQALVDRLVCRDRLAQRGAGQLPDLAEIAFVEIRRGLFRRGEIFFERGTVPSRIQIGKIPLRQTRFCGGPGFTATGFGHG